MNPSYFRIRLSLDVAMSRFRSWFPAEEVEEPRETDCSKAVESSVDESGGWKGAAVFVHEADGWTTFEDYTGYFNGLGAASWLKFAGLDDFVMAGYNDAICTGEIIEIKNGEVMREFLDDPEFEQPPDTSLAGGFSSWIDVASFVDEDELSFAEQGTLYILKRF